MTVSKRRISLPERHLRDTATSAGRMLERWPTFAAVCAASTPAPLRAASGGGRSTDVADPVLAIVVARARHDEMADKVYALWHQARWLAVNHLNAAGATRTTPPGQLEMVINYCQALAERWDFLSVDIDLPDAVHALLTEAYEIEDSIADVLKTTKRPTANRSDKCACGDWVEPGRKGMCIACYWKDYRQGLDGATSDMIETRSTGLARPQERSAAHTCRCGWVSDIIEATDDATLRSGLEQAREAHQPHCAMASPRTS